MQVDREWLTGAEIAAIVKDAARGASIYRDGSTSTRIARAVERLVAQRVAEASLQEFLLMCETAAKESRATQEEIARKGSGSMDALCMQFIAAGAEKQAQRLAEILRARGAPKEPAP